MSGRELAERDGERSRTQGRVVERGELARRVRTAGRTYEDHPGRHSRKLRVLGVVAGAAHEQIGVDADVFDRAAKEQRDDDD